METVRKVIPGAEDSAQPPVKRPAPPGTLRLKVSACHQSVSLVTRGSGMAQLVLWPLQGLALPDLPPLEASVFR